jgi:competence protein ComEA
VRSLLAVLVFALAALPALAGEPALTGMVNVNTATVDQLVLLPGIGESRANALIQARKQRGGFKTVNELLDVKGIGEAGLAKLRPHVALQGKTTAQLAQAD